MIYSFAISEEVVMKLDLKEQHKAERKRKIMFIMDINKLWKFRNNKI